MINIDWIAVMLGLGVGGAMSAIFFMGLAFGMRCALRSESPVKLLSLSAALRIVALLGVGWIVMGQGGPWATLGYGIAFFATRFIVTTVVRIGTPSGGAL